MLKIEHLTKKYDQYKAVDDLSLEIDDGLIYGFIGHNGAGKTTTLKSVVGILPFDEGDIFIDGKSIKKNPLECKKEMELRHNGAWYHISPWGLSWDDENYYLVGYDSEAEQIKHYRVDKMLHIRMSNESREGKEYFKKLDMADYAKKSFGMFRGKEQTVKMQVDNRLAGVIIDRFGKDVMMIPTDEEHFTVKVDVHVSRQFLGWIFSLGEGIKIVGPEEVVNQMKAECERLMGQYQLPQ